MIHSGNKKYSTNNAMFTIAGILSATVAIISTLTTLYSGINLVLDLEIPGMHKTSIGVFLASFLVFATSTVLLLGSASISKMLEAEPNQNQTQNNSSQLLQAGDATHNNQQPKNKENTSGDSSHSPQNEQPGDDNELENDNTPPNSTTKDPQAAGVGSPKDQAVAV